MTKDISYFSGWQLCSSRTSHGLREEDSGRGQGDGVQELGACSTAERQEL